MRTSLKSFIFSLLPTLIFIGLLEGLFRFEFDMDYHWNEYAHERVAEWILRDAGWR